MRRGRLESCYLNHNEPEKVIGLNPLWSVALDRVRKWIDEASSVCG